jgi:uncharacterized membrane protein
MGATNFATWPVAVYGVVLLLAAIAYTILCRVLIAHHGTDSPLARAVGSDRKGKVSMLIYGLTIPVAFASPTVACLLYVLVAVLWLVPDRRIEKTLTEESQGRE